MKTDTPMMDNKPLIKQLKALIVACITGDGHLQIKYWRYLTSFYSKNMDEIEFHKRLFKRVYGVQSHLYPCERAHKLFFISKYVAEDLAKAGAPVGNKVNQAFSVPNWVFRGNRRIMGNYLQGLYTCEGSIYKRKNPNQWLIRIEMYKKECLENDLIGFMEQLRTMLSCLNIKTSPVRNATKSIRKDGSVSIGKTFEIHKSSFRNFYKRVGFYSHEKQRKLLIALRGNDLWPNARVTYKSSEPSG